MQAKAGNGHQTNRPGDDIAHLLQLVLKALVVADDFPAGLIEKLAFAGQGELLAGALQKRNTQPDLDGAELLAHR